MNRVEQLVIPCACLPAIDPGSIIVLILIGFVVGAAVGWQMAKDRER